MADRVDHVERHEPVGQEVERPRCAALGRVRAPERDEPGLDLAGHLAERVARPAWEPVEGDVQPVLDGPLAEPLDSAGGYVVAIGDLDVGQRGGAVGLVGGEEHEGPLDGLGLGAASGDEGLEVCALVRGEGDAVALWHGRLGEVSRQTTLEVALAEVRRTDGRSAAKG